MFEKMNERVKRMTVVDIGLTKAAVFCFALFITKLYPQILYVRLRYMLLLAVLCSIKPVYSFWFKR